MTVFAMEPMPLAGAFADTHEAALAAERYPLEWRACGMCGLVNVWPDIPDEVIYRHYSYRASEVPALVRHHEGFAAYLVERYPKTKVVVEVGGNDGVLLQRLPGDWLRVNVDPSDAIWHPKLADTHTYQLMPQPFDRTAGERLAGRADLVLSSNAFAHFTGIGEALDAARQVLCLGGRFIVEVHDLAATLRSGQWDTVYHEHKVEWSAESLTAAAGLHGLELVSITRLPLHGGLIRATFRRGRARRPGTPEHPDFASLQRAYDSRVSPSLPRGAVAYGAAARATVYLNQTGADVAYVVDGSPRRQGRHVPGTGQPIVTPERFEADQPPAALITAWTQAEDIRARHPDYRGQWVTAWS